MAKTCTLTLPALTLPANSAGTGCPAAADLENYRLTFCRAAATVIEGAIGATDTSFTLRDSSAFLNFLKQTNPNATNFNGQQIVIEGEPITLTNTIINPDGTVSVTNAVRGAGQLLDDGTLALASTAAASHAAGTQCYYLQYPNIVARTGTIALEDVGTQIEALGSQSQVIGSQVLTQEEAAQAIASALQGALSVQ